MIRLLLVRQYLEKQTIGKMYVYRNLYEPTAFECASLEPPWRNNFKDVSCIPEGLYPCKKIVSPNFGQAVAVNEVPGRSLIRIHFGNWTWNTTGCILPGRKHLFMDGDSLYDVNHSKDTLDDLLKALPIEFEMKIVGL